MLPSISLADETSSSLCFTYAWDAKKIDLSDSATVASWQGGSNSSYRGAFVVFDLPSSFVFKSGRTSVSIDFSINSALLNNGINQAPTAAVVLVNGDNVKNGYSSASYAVLSSEKNNGTFLGTYKIDSDPSENALKDIDITSYFENNENVSSIGIYLTNVASDGFDCVGGIASKMSDFSISINALTQSSVPVHLTDDDGNLLGESEVVGNLGDEVDVSDFVETTLYSGGKKYSLESLSYTKITLNDENDDIYAKYRLVESSSLLYGVIRSGYSGVYSSDGEGLFVATSTSSSSGSATNAPTVSGTSHSGGKNMASSRCGALEFEISSDIDENSINQAYLKFYVSSVHSNLGSNTMRLALYETDNPYLDSYSMGEMDHSKFPAKDNDYSVDALYWSEEEISSSSLGWKSVSLKKIILNALDKNNSSSSPSETVRIVLRLEVPIAGMYITSSGDNRPYLEIVTKDSSLVLQYDFTSLTDDGKIEDISGNGFDGTLLDEAKIQDGQLILNGNGGVQIESEDFRKKLDSYTISTFVTLTDSPVTNTRIYDFGASAYNSGFLRVRDFAVGMKYAGGTTTLVSQNQDGDAPFEKSGEKYHIAVSYDSSTNLTKVYVNGEIVISTTAITHSLSDFESSTANNFIGRTTWHLVSSQASANPDIKAVYEDFRVYSQALDDRVVFALYNSDFESGVKNAAKSIEDLIKSYSENPVTDSLSFDSVYESENGESFPVTWHSSDPSVIDLSGNVFRGAENLSSYVYATVSLGEYSVSTSSYKITVAHLSDDEIDKSAVLRYLFDESGEKITDEINGLDATATSASVQQNGRASLSKGNVIKLPDNVNKDVTDYTVAAWIRVDDITNDSQRIYDFGVENGTASKNYYAFAKVNSNGSLTVGVNNGGTTQTVSSVGTVPEGEWTHVAFSYNSSTGLTYIYINGVLDSSSSAITYTMANALYQGKSTSNYIGRSQWYKTQSSTNPDFNGKIDTFEFYRTSFTQSVIKKLMDKGFDSPEVEISSSMFVEGMDTAIVNISSNGYSGDVFVAVPCTNDGYLLSLGTAEATISDGLNSVSVSVPRMGGSASSEDVECYVWQSPYSLTPLCGASEICRTYSFGFDYTHPDNNLLHNNFSLRLYDTDQYLTVSNGVSLADFDEDDDNFLWTAPYEYSGNAEGYYALQGKDGTYLSLDSGTLKTGKINNWRFIQIDPSLVDGANNVYAIRQRSSGKYLSKSGASSNYSSSDSWWVLDVREYDELSRAFVSSGFLSLSSNERSMLYSVTSQAMWQSSNRRNKLLDYMGSNYFSISASEQAERLKKLFSYTPSSQINRTVNPDTTKESRSYSLSEVTGAANYTGKDGEDLWAYKAVATYYTDSSQSEVLQTVTIYGRSANAITNIAKGFSYIPYQFGKYIKTIKDYYHTANQFNCGSSEMYVRTTYEVSAEGFAMTASHEVGHSLSASWGTVHSSSRYNSAIASDLNKVSGYGNSNNAEDFAEFTQFVISCSGDAELLREVKTMFPHRFAVLKAVLNEMNSGNGILNSAD
jgi:hypothetical protein